MTEHWRDLIDILQALLTPTIAFIAVGIAFAQWWTAHKRLKLDLFNRRWAVYVALRELLAEITARGKVSVEADQKFWNGVRGAKWLFDDAIDDYLTKVLWKKIAALNALNTDGGASEKQEIKTWFSAQYTAIDSMLDKFLRIEEPFFGVLRRRLARRRRRRRGVAWTD
jgi:hypothetical protein